MKKTVNICGYDIEVAVNAASLLIYKKAFHRDGFQDIEEIKKFIRSMSRQDEENQQENESEIQENENLDYELIYRFFWTFVYCADPNIPEYEEYFTQFEVSPVKFFREALIIVIQLLIDNSKSTVKSRKKSKKQTTEE